MHGIVGHSTRNTCVCIDWLLHYPHLPCVHSIYQILSVLYCLRALRASECCSDRFCLRGVHKYDKEHRNLKADTHEGFCSRSMLQDHFARVSTHEGALFAPGACSQVFNRLNIVEHFCGVEILLPRMKYTHEIVGTHGGALLPERAPGACSGSKTPRVYRP